MQTMILNRPKSKFVFKKPENDIDKVIQAFLSGQTGKFGKYYAVKNALVYRTIITSNYGQEVSIAQNIIALKLIRNGEPVFIGNSSILPLIGRKSSWGNEKLNNKVTEIQNKISTHIQMIPFTVFSEANLSLNNINILERGNEETLVRKIPNTIFNIKNDKNLEPEFIDETIHYTGSSLFEVNGNYFLFDIDRIEIQHKIFNPFLVKLTNKVTSISEAYQSLKPIEVVVAESLKMNVKRQGEWFFIPTTKDFTYEMGSVMGKEETTLHDMMNRHWQIETYELRAGQNRPNNAQMGVTINNNEHYVKGWVVHSGREHEPLMLNDWHKCVPNTSIESFTIRGDID